MPKRSFILGKSPNPYEVGSHDYEIYEEARRLYADLKEEGASQEPLWLHWRDCLAPQLEQPLESVI